MTGTAIASQDTASEHPVLPVVRQWSHFLSELEDMLQAGPPLVEQAEPSSFVDIEQATAFFQKLSEALDAYTKSGAGISFWEIAGIGSDEVKNCAVLAWLLDCHGSHGYGNSFCRALLDSLRLAAAQSGFDIAQLPAQTDLSPDYDVSRECSYEELVLNTDGEDKSCIYSRVDIQLSGKNFLLFVEAKIYSGENGNQLRRYRSHLDIAANGRKRSFVYLTRTGHLPDDTYLHDSVLPLRWRDVADAITACVTREMVPGSAGYIFIKQFCEHISNF